MTTRRALMGIAVLLGIGGIAWLLSDPVAPGPAPDALVAPHGPLEPRSSSRPVGEELPGSSGAIPETAPFERGEVSEDAADGNSPRTGRVVDPAGVPVAGAEVRVVEARGSTNPKWLEIRADGEGRFRLPALPAGPWLIHAHDGQRTSNWVDLVIDEQSRSEVAALDDLVLQPGLRVSGQVVDDLGRPVEGASVQLWHVHDDGRVTDPLAFERHVETTADGAFRIEGNRPCPLTRLSVRHDGHYMGVRAIEFPLDADVTRTVVVTRYASISGRVLGPDGEPAASTMLSLGIGPLVTAAEDGSFTFPNLQSEQREDWTLSAMSLGLEAVGTTPVDPRPGVPLEGVVVQLQASGTLSGRVVDGEGRPVAGATVKVEHDEQRRRWARISGAALSRAPVPGWKYTFEEDLLTTDEDGHWSVPVPVTSSVILSVSKEGWLFDEEPRQLDVAVGVASTGHVLRLTRGGMIEGTITGWSSNPDAIQLSVLDRRGRYTGAPRELRGDGTFTVGPLVAGAYRLVAQLKLDGEDLIGFTPQLQAAYGQTLREVTIALQREAVFTGMVTDAAGQPAVDARVLLERSGFDGPATATDAAGQFRLQGMAPGAWSLWVSSSGFATYRARTIEIAPGARVQHDVRLTRGSSVEISVLGPGGPEAGASVELRRAGWPTISGNTGAGGLFSASAVATGTWQVLVRAVEDSPLCGRAQVEVPTDGTTAAVTVTLDDGGTASGRVVDAKDGVVRVWAVGIDGLTDTRSAWVDEDDRFEIRGLHPGTYRLMWHDGEDPIHGSRFTQKPGKPTLGLIARPGP